MSTDQKTTTAEIQTEHGHEFTPTGMVSFLLQNGLTVDQIEGRIAAPQDFVKSCLGDMTILSGEIDPSIVRLKDLYLREQIKSFLRASPFLGIAKGAQRMGIDSELYSFIYKSLINSGEVKFTTETPEWSKVGDKKSPLRKHIVK